MATVDYNPDPGLGLRTGVTTEQLQQASQRSAIQREQNEKMAMAAFTVALVIMAVVAIYVVRHRRRLAVAADAAIVSSLASGVRAGRVAASRVGGFKARVLAKADENYPRPD